MVEHPCLHSTNLTRRRNNYRMKAGGSDKRRNSKRHSNRSKSPSDRDKSQARHQKAKEKLESGLKAPAVKSRRNSAKEQESTTSQQKSTNQNSSQNKQSEGESEIMGIFDKTQWENTRCAKEADNFKKNKGLAPVIGAEQMVVGNNVVPGEDRQEMRTQGEQLLERSNLMLGLLITEMVLTIVALCVWCTAAVNPNLPQILAIFNMAIVFLLVTVILAAEYFRFHVQLLEESPLVRYYIPYKWRFQLCGMNMVRIFLICADITIMALDDDFDAGSIIVLALQPIHLILNAIHVIIALRPKTKQ